MPDNKNIPIQQFLNYLKKPSYITNKPVSLVGRGLKALCVTDYNNKKNSPFLPDKFLELIKDYANQEKININLKIS